MRVQNVGLAVAFREDRFSKVNLFETQRFFCDLYCLRPGQSQRVHSHEHNDKIYVVERGEAEVTVGEESRRLGRGDVVLAAAGEPHGIANKSNADVVCIVFMAPHPSLSTP